MKAPAYTPPKRPRRPAPPPMPTFDKLDRTHAQAMEMLEQFAILLGRLERDGLDDEARRSAQAICDFFDGPGRTHHADEERLVFPGLLAGGDAELASHVRRLQQDHGWIEEDWRMLEPQVRSVAQNVAGYDLEMLRLAVPVFTKLYHEHIALEESLVYPAAKHQQAALDAGAQSRSTPKEEGPSSA